MENKMNNTPSGISYTTNGLVTFYGTLTLQQWVALAGLALGLLTFLTTQYYQRKSSKRDAEHKARLEAIEQEKLEILKSQTQEGD